MPHTPSSLRRLLLLSLAILLLSSAIPCLAQRDLTDIGASDADAFLARGGGAWVMEKLDSTPITGLCVNKTSYRFQPGHTVVKTTCDAGNILSTTQTWKVTATSGGNSLNLGNETYPLALKDAGKSPDHDYHMRIRATDEIHLKVSVPYDYKFVPDKR